MNGKGFQHCRGKFGCSLLWCDKQTPRQKRRGFLFMERESQPGIVLVGTPLRGVRCADGTEVTAA